MNKLTGLFRKLRLRQILTVFLAGVLLFASTACNSGDVRGARPNNPPVQAGGANNPHKGDGDGYTNYKMSTDPKVNTPKVKSERDSSKAGNSGSHADASLLSNNLIATSEAESYTTEANPGAKLIYPSSKPLETDKFGSSDGNKSVLDNSGESRENGKGRTDLDPQILKRAGAVFKDASGFLKEGADRPYDSQEKTVQKK